MARSPRVVLPEQPLHVIQRGNNRTRTFVTPADRSYFLSVLERASRGAGCAVHAYALMSNHVHLLVTPADARAPARMMQAIGRSYVRYFNDRHRRTGTLWEGRYRSSPIVSDRYFLACSRYVELNAVRAGLVRQPIHFPWSSFHHNAHGAANRVVTPHAIYLALASDPVGRRAAYRALFDAPLMPDTVDAIRRATRIGAVLGAGSDHMQPGEVRQQQRSDSTLAVPST